MPDPRPLTGLYGKVPAHGDFVRRGLPTSFVGPWDDWLQRGMAAARDRFGDHWPQAWDAAPCWRFALPAGACGPDAVAGVMLPSEDMVGRRFPITLAAILPAGAGVPEPAWFAALEHAARAGRAGLVDADALAAAIPAPGEAIPLGATPPLPTTWSQEEVTAASDVVLPMVSAALPDRPGQGDDVLAMLAGDAVAPVAGRSAEPLEGLGPQAGEDAPPASPTMPAPSAQVARDAPPAAAEPLEGFGRIGCGAGAIEPVARPDRRDADILALLGSGDVARSLPPDPPPAGPEADGTLAFLLGAAGGEPSAVTSGAAGDPLSALIAAGGPSGRAPAEDEIATPIPTAANPEPMTSIAADPAGDPLSELIAAGGPLDSAPSLDEVAAPIPTAANPEPMTSIAADPAGDPLSALIAAGGPLDPAPAEDDVAAPIPTAANPEPIAAIAVDPGGDPLSVLIATGGPLDLAPARDDAAASIPTVANLEPAALVGADPGGDPLSALIAAGGPSAAAPTDSPAALPPPDAPPRGGWWTGGAERCPPTAWPLASLPAATDFASLLERDA